MTLYTYSDPEEDFQGFLAITGVDRPLAAGGMRVHPELTAERVEALARTMQHKESVLRVNVDGAKCGIAYDPTAAGKREAIGRFLRYLAPHLEERLSLGPDMGTSFHEIEVIAREEGIPSVKSAIGRAQGLSAKQVRRRLDLLDVRAGQLTLGERRAGHGVAGAALAAVRVGEIESRPITCAIQGFGTLGRGAAFTLDSAGVLVRAIADEHECVRADAGLPIPAMLSSPAGTQLRMAAPEAEVLPREAVLGMSSDLLLLTACENAFAGSTVDAVRAAAVVVGANGGLSSYEYERLAAQEVLTVPDIVAGCGGSAAMDALFAPDAVPTTDTVLEAVGNTIDALTVELLAEASAGMTSYEAALHMARRVDLPADARPYGLRVLAAAEVARKEPAAPLTHALTSRSR
jgi:glutamate dehydrogenase (NAD(P)+)